MVAPARLRRIAPVATPDEAATRLYQSLYGCTLHSSGLLHTIAAILNAEADGSLALAQVAEEVAHRAQRAAQLAPPAEAWRYETMGALCRRLSRSPR
jgi:hypothetical protein